MASRFVAGVLRWARTRRAAHPARPARCMDRRSAYVIHEIPLERRTLHGHFSRDLPPIIELDSGDTIAFGCLDAGWHTRPGEAKFEPRDEELDAGHALIG